MVTATRTAPVTARRLIDNRIRDYEGNGIGEVEDFVIDPAKGCIDYAIVSFGGFMGLGKQYHVIPYQRLQIHPDGRSFMSNLRRDQLERAPGFDKGNVPEMDEQYLSSVYSYWGAQRGGGTQQPAEGQQRGGGMQQATEGQVSSSGMAEPMAGTESTAEQRERREGENRGSGSPWQERYRGLFWHGDERDR